MFTLKRKHTRVPLSLEVDVEGPGVQCKANSVELGGGGMSLSHADQLSISLPVRVAFTLPPAMPVSLHAVVWWKRDKLVGIRFDPADRTCQLVQRYLEESVAAGDD